MISSNNLFKMAAKNFKETRIYLLAYEQAMDIFSITKSFPPEEKYSLIDQIRRSSRSVCTNIAEAYRKKRYPLHFVSKITDSDAENSETNVLLDFSRDCGYIAMDLHLKFIARNEEIGRLLGHMMNNPDKY